MSLKGTLAKNVAQLSQSMLKKYAGGGSSFPGKIAEKIDPEILGELGKNYDVVIITGTNGKTMTTSFTVNILKQKFQHLLTNDTGSNLKQGIIATFVGDNIPELDDENERPIAVLEVDEATVRHITKYIQPKLIVATNIFRDQMDRYGEIYTIFDFIKEGAALTPETPLLLNGDAAIFNDTSIDNPVFYFGFANDDLETDKRAHYNTDNVLCPVCHHLLHYHAITYSNLGDYFCPNCGFKRPSLAYQVTDIKELTPDSSMFELNGATYQLPVAGTYNIYNALAAFSIGKFFGLSDEDIREGFRSASRVFGRQEVIAIDGKVVRINLIKNPVGFNQITEIIKLQEDPYTMITLLNDQPADGQDVSWIWDADFESLAQMPENTRQIIGGQRREALKQRLLVAGFESQTMYTVNSMDGVIHAIQEAPTETVNILTTYTAMLALRKTLAEKGYVKERMHA